jgi:hypothetical protein
MLALSAIHISELNMKIDLVGDMMRFIKLLITLSLKLHTWLTGYHCLMTNNTIMGLPRVGISGLQCRPNLMVNANHCLMTNNTTMGLPRVGISGLQHRPNLMVNANHCLMTNNTTMGLPRVGISWLQHRSNLMVNANTLISTCLGCCIA